MMKHLSSKLKIPKISQLISFALITLLIFLVAFSENTARTFTSYKSELSKLDGQPDKLTLIHKVYKLARKKDFTALQPPPPVRSSLKSLGQALLFDKILSGNKDISCMTFAYQSWLQVMRST